ncbi:hypothetical protein V8C86DRAFT_366995 [Haematococcus lacustris]
MKDVDPKLHRSLATTCRDLLKATLHDEPCINVRWQAEAPDAPLLPAYVRDTLQTRSMPLSLIVTKVAIRNDEGRFIRAVTSSSGVLAVVEHLTLPSLAPLAAHLTHLTLHLCDQSLTQALTALSLSPRLRVLITDGGRGSWDLDQPGLQQLLRDLPNLQELVLPHVVVSGMQTLDALLAATQITRLGVQTFTDLAESRAGARCSWRHLEVRCGAKEHPYWDWATAACLPLRSLAQPLSIGCVRGSWEMPPDAVLSALALRCRAGVQIQCRPSIRPLWQQPSS